VLVPSDPKWSLLNLRVVADALPGVGSRSFVAGRGMELWIKVSSAT
jgi:hypothetical protein